MNFVSFSDRRAGPLAVALLSACVLAPSVSAQNLLPAELSDLGYVRVQGEAVSAPIPNPGAGFEIGDMIPLVAVTPTQYIGLTEYEEGAARLCVFPRVLPDGQGTAWMSGQYDLIFGSPVSSTGGALPLRQMEILPILFETETDYQVLCERHGRTFSLTLPRDLEGTTYYASLPGHLVERVRQEEKIGRKLVDPDPWLQSESDIASLRAELLTGMGPSALMDTPPEAAAKAAPIGPVRTVEPPAEPAHNLRQYALQPAEPLVIPKLSKVYPRLPDPPAEAAPAGAEASADSGESEPAGDAPAPPVTDMPPVDLAEAMGPPEPSPAESHRPEPPAEPVPAPEAVVVQLPEPTPAEAVLARTAILESAILPSDRDTQAARIDPAPLPAPDPVPAPSEPAPTQNPSDEMLNTVAVAALKLLILLLVLTGLFLATIFVLARIVNRRTRTKKIEAQPEPPPLEEIPEFAGPEPPAVPTDGEALPADAAEPAPDDDAPPEPPPEPEDMDLPASVRPVNDPSLGTFTGSLQGFSISELVQFLNSTGETGSLFVSEPESTHNSCLVFEEGTIVHALHEAETGLDAARQILGLQDGFFVFQRQPGITVERTIEVGTLELLMSLSQDIDETTGLLPVEESMVQP